MPGERVGRDCEPTVSRGLANLTAVHTTNLPEGHGGAEH